MTWRNAPILDALHNEANQLGATFLGTVGDLAHQAQGSASDHNPDANGIVHAIDLSYGDAAANWTAAQKIANYLRAHSSQGASIKYLVSNDLSKDVIASGPGWGWRENGVNQQNHRSHVHTSVNSGPTAENDTRPLIIPALRGAPTPPVPAPTPPPAPIIREDSNVKLMRGDATPEVWLVGATAKPVHLTGDAPGIPGTYGPWLLWCVANVPGSVDPKTNREWVVPQRQIDAITK